MLKPHMVVLLNQNILHGRTPVPSTTARRLQVLLFVVYWASVTVSGRVSPGRMGSLPRVARRYTRNSRWCLVLEWSRVRTAHERGPDRIVKGIGAS